MSDEIKGFKMMNGVDLVAKLVGETDTHYLLEDAIYYELVQIAEGKMDVQFAPLTFGAKMPINQDHPAMKVDMPKISVLFPYEIRDEIAARLKQMVSPIVLLTK